MNYYSESNPKTEIIMRECEDVKLIYRLIPCKAYRKTVYIILLTSIDGDDITDAAVTFTGGKNDAIAFMTRLCDSEITPVSVRDIIDDEKHEINENEKFSKKGLQIRFVVIQ